MMIFNQSSFKLAPPLVIDVLPSLYLLLEALALLDVCEGVLMSPFSGSVPLLRPLLGCLE